MASCGIQCRLLKKVLLSFECDDIGLVLSSPAAGEQEWRRRVASEQVEGHDGTFCVETEV